MKYWREKSLGRRRGMTMIVAAALATLSGQAAAVKIDTGNPDGELRWDNTVKYNAGWRVQQRNDAIGDAWGYQAGDYKFDKGDMVTNRVDLLTEFDFVYKSHYGFRVSGAAWSDAAYHDDVRGNPKFTGFLAGTAYPNNKFTPFAKRYNTTSGELLDAFVFGRIDIGDMPLDLKAGRHTVYWGESLFTPIHGVSYSQSPADFRKALATPGIEVKELFLPLNQVSAHLQVSDSVSVAAQYMLEWKPLRLPDGGTYLSQGDIIGNGGTNFLGIPVNGDLNTGRDATPKNSGNWGIMAKASPAWLDGTVGIYYRKFDDKVPAVLSPGGTFSELHNAYAKDVKLVGVSLAKSVGGVSIGAEVVHRQNTALATYFGAADIARGDTWHALVNALAYIGQTPAFDSAVLLGELTYSRLGKIYSGSEANFNGVDYAHCKAGEPGYGSYVEKDGCATKDAWGLSLLFTPTWFQALPSVDLSMPISYSVGLAGNSPVPAGGNKGSGSWSIGLGADYMAKYKFNLAYNAYFGDMGTNTSFLGTQAINGATNAGNATLKDRGWLSLTFKTSF
jgi:hypothetical protein